MTLFFASIIITSFILFILIKTRITQKGTVSPIHKNNNTTAKVYFNIYAMIVCGILCYQIFYFIGFKKYETPRLPLHLQRGIVHLGYYVAPDSQFVFSADSANNGFGVDLLSSQEKITLIPIYENRDANQWRIQYNSLTYPLRIDNRCVNVPGNAWFNHPGDAFYILVKTREQKGNYFISFKYWQNSFYLSCGIVRLPGGWDYHLRDARVLTIELKEGITIDRLLHLSTNNDIKNHQRLFPPGLKRIFSKIRFIREIKDNRFSHVGVLPDHSLLTDSSFLFFMNDKPLPIHPEEKQIVLNCRDKILYGFGNRSFGIGLSQYPSLDERLGNLLECRFKNLKIYPLPPDIRKPFIITNDNSHILLDGYYFDIGINNHSFYAKASFS